jgi:hypothetical protein
VTKQEREEKETGEGRRNKDDIESDLHEGLAESPGGGSVCAALVHGVDTVTGTIGYQLSLVPHSGFVPY